jgi:glucose-6-phosphate-specific signal transduction histidine kinase
VPSGHGLTLHSISSAQSLCFSQAGASRKIVKVSYFLLALFVGMAWTLLENLHPITVIGLTVPIILIAHRPGNQPDSLIAETQMFLRALAVNPLLSHVMWKRDKI